MVPFDGLFPQFPNSFTSVMLFQLFQPSSEPPLHRCARKPTLSRGHDLEEEQLRWRRDVGHPTLG